MPAAVIEQVGDAHANKPEGFTVHPKIQQLLDKRLDMSRNGQIDWGFGELLAFGSVLMEGTNVRLAGQDARRGTFVQRHAVLHDRQNGQEWLPLANLSQNQGRFYVYDSLLSEYAAMAFEYGYSVERPDTLTLWEAQFGDFANGAQSVIDEYISAADQKWGQQSSVVLLLPHGYEGQGPDHSSARIERYLQLCAEGSMTVAQPSTPANHFHLLRRQALGEMKRPLVVFTPKSMLRNKAATSAVEDFTEVKRFQSVINDPNYVDVDGKKVGDTDKVKTIMLVSGKLYWDLEKKREADGRDDIAIVRVEMLHPIPFNRLSDAFKNYPNAKEIRWVQDEPANQGAWPFLALQLPEYLPGIQLKRVSRRAQSSTATGVAKVHQMEQKALMEEAFED